MPTRWTQPIAQLLATTLTLWLSFVLLGDRGGFFYVWPLTAVQLAIALGNWRDNRERFLQLLACCTGELAATTLLGMPVWIGCALAVIQTLVVGCVATMLAQQVVRFDDLKKRKNVVRFGLAALLVPFAAVALAAFPIAALTHKTALRTWEVVAPSDALGIAIILPPLLFLISGEYRSFRQLRPHLAAGIPVILLFLAAVGLIFCQNSMPLLFLVFLPMTFVLLLLGLEGAVFASASITVIASWATVHGHGPLWLVRGGMPETRFMVLQAFLAAVVTVGLPVGALLDEQRKAERIASE